MQDEVNTKVVAIMIKGGKISAEVLKKALDKFVQEIEKAQKQMSQDEIAVMDGAKCILQLRGVRPFLSNKYDITKHPKYRQLSDYDKRNAFDIEKYRQHKLVVKPDDTFDLYDMGEVEAD